MLWTNKAIFEEHGLTAPTTWDEFFTVADTLKAAGVTPLALGDRDGWTALNLFEQILLGELGPEDYRGIWAGTVPWTDERVTAALETFGRALDYVNEDHSTLTWDQAVQLVIDGGAAMNVMGDWAKGYFTSKGWSPDVEFGWAPDPGHGRHLHGRDRLVRAAARGGEPGERRSCGSRRSRRSRRRTRSIRSRARSRRAWTRTAPSTTRTRRRRWTTSRPTRSCRARPTARRPSRPSCSRITDAISLFVTSRDVAGTQAAIDEACRSTGACPS